MRKKLPINLLLFLLILLGSRLPLVAQETESSSVIHQPKGFVLDSQANNSDPQLAYTHKLSQVVTDKYIDASLVASETDAPVDGNKKDRHWLLPDHATLQFAGSIGVGSLGAGYRNPKNTLEGELLLGYLPASMGGDHFFTPALKGNWLPFLLFEDRKVQLYPIQTGVMVAYTFGSEFFSKQPDYYPKGYYPFSTAIHAYWQLGSRISVPMKTNRLEFYYELNASAEEIITLVQNPNFITPGKIFSLALGLKLNFEP